MIHVSDPEKFSADGRLYWRYSDGTVLPVIAGGAGDDDLEVEDDDEESDDDADDEEEEDDDDVSNSPMSAEESAKVRRALNKANKEAKKYRLEAKQLREKTEGEQEKATREAVESATEEVEKTWKSRMVKTEAKAALVSAGLTSGVQRLVNLIDVEEVEVDDDGEVSGLDAQIADLKKDFPDLFDKKRSVEGKGDAGNRESRSKKPKSSAERIAEFANG